MLAITLDNLSRRFGQTRAVDEVSLVIPPGSLFFLLGPSGCGKTTLLRMIAGFTHPTAGRILFDGQDITASPPHRRDTGMVFQSYALWPHMTVADNVGFGLDVRKIAGPARAARINEALQLVQMDHLADRKPNQLSGGQQQRVALARALAIRPRCLLLDEPLSNLDAKLRSDMRSEIRRIVKASGITAVYVTHDQKEALAMADAIALLRAGRLQQTGAPDELYRRPASRFVADFLGESNFLAATITERNQETIELATAVGRLQARVAAAAAWRVGQPVLAAFRPEAVALAAAGGGQPNSLGARRISTTYLGEMAEHVVELANGCRIKSYELNPPTAGDFNPNALCAVTIAPENIMLVPPEEAAAAAPAGLPPTA